MALQFILQHPNQVFVLQELSCLLDMFRKGPWEVMGHFLVALTWDVGRRTHCLVGGQGQAVL